MKFQNTWKQYNEITSLAEGEKLKFYARRSKETGKFTIELKQLVSAHAGYESTSIKQELVDKFLDYIGIEVNDVESVVGLT